EEPRKAPLSRSHFLAQHPGVAAAEEKNQPALRDGGGAHLRRLLDGRQLGFANSLEQFGGAIEVNSSGAHAGDDDSNTDVAHASACRGEPRLGAWGCWLAL